MSALIDTFSRTDPNVIHVLPADDQVAHSNRGFACICGPHVSVIDGFGWMVTHQALDGRE